MNATTSHRYAGTPPRRERGIVLFIALVVLVAMTLAGLAMFRQVGTGITIAGNLAFKQNATSVGDMGVEAARAWLMPPSQNAATLQADIAPGYCSTWQTDFNPPATRFSPATYDWTGSGGCANNSGSTLVTSDDGTGNEVRYVVHRMCSVTGAVNGPTQQCVTFGSSGAGGSKGGGSYGTQNLTNTVQPYFRITVRVAGPRNTVSYVQAIMY